MTEVAIRITATAKRIYPQTMGKIWKMNKIIITIPMIDLTILSANPTFVFMINNFLVEGIVLGSEFWIGWNRLK